MQGKQDPKLLSFWISGLVSENSTNNCYGSLQPLHEIHMCCFKTTIAKQFCRFRTSAVGYTFPPRLGAMWHLLLTRRTFTVLCPFSLVQKKVTRLQPSESVCVRAGCYFACLLSLLRCSLTCCSHIESQQQMRCGVDCRPCSFSSLSQGI